MWDCVKNDVWAKVVAALFALLADSAGTLWFDRNPLANSGCSNILANRGDGSGQLVAKNKWLTHNHRANVAVVIKMNIAAAYSNGGNLD
jgi:hypothetical protein